MPFLKHVEDVPMARSAHTAYLRVPTSTLSIGSETPNSPAFPWVFL